MPPAKRAKKSALKPTGPKEPREFASGPKELYSKGTNPLELRYFGLLAKGLGPTLVAEFSGLPYRGNKDLGYTREAWPELKPKTPFGQLPLLTTGDGMMIAQTAAIINYIGKVSYTEGNGAEYALSQMLLAEAEDVFKLMQQFVPTLFAKLGQGTKGNRAQYDEFWSTKLPPHLAALEKLCAPGTGLGTSPGALYAFSILHQVCLIRPDFLTAEAGKQPGALALWYASTLADARTAKVLAGESTMGELKQYFVAPEDDDEGEIDP